MVAAGAIRRDAHLPMERIYGFMEVFVDLPA
jgi:hypothetical protein